MSKETVSIPFSGEGEKFVPNALKWLYELEALDSPALLNNLYGNIYASSRHVKDVQLLVDKNEKKMLIYMKFSWKARLLLGVKKRTAELVLDNLQELLPSFQFRITEKKDLFEKALENAKKVALGRKDENSDTNNSSPDNNDSDNATDSSTGKENVQQTSDLLPNKKEQTKDK